MTLNNICEYACNENWSELKCIFKRLYSDFIVIEIPQDGNILKPNFDVTYSDDEEENNKTNISKELPKQLECLNEQISKFSKLIEDELDECIIDLKNFTKDVRKLLYDFIRYKFGQSLCTNCKDGILIVKKAKMNDSNNRKRKFWPKHRGDYLHFTLTKVNMDTNTCIDLIANRLNIKPSIFSVSGTKDRRAITVQRVCVYRVEKRRLINQKFRGLWLSDFIYSDKKLELGDTKGNYFSIILRDIDDNFNLQDFTERIDKWKDIGFLNYFGSQRFGSCGIDTAEIGRLILNQKWEESVKALLAPRLDASIKINDSLQHFSNTGNATESLKLLTDRSAIIERSLLVFLSNHPNQFKGALLSLPRNIRTMYVHAYQSSVFNQIISRRKKLFGLKFLPGDLNNKGEVLNNSDVKKIENVCLPLPSFENKLPENEVGEWYKQIEKDDQINYKNFKEIERHFGLGNVYRPFLLKPENVSWSILNYSERNEELQSCDFIPKKDLKELKNEEIKEESIKKALKIQFILPSGTYATIALRELMRIDFSKESQKEMELGI